MEPVHIAAPFKIAKAGVTTNVQNSPEDISTSVYNIAVCPEGFREDDPEYGIPPLEFETVPLELGPVEEAIERIEPKAELESIEQAEAMNQGLRQVILEVSP